MKPWNLRDEILEITHRWYQILMFILFGAIVGWGCSYLWPSPHRATMDLYVGLNPYRSPYDSQAAASAGQTFRMVDDYKNWQMDQLNEFIKSETVIAETLSRLSERDSDWDYMSVQEFREGALALWRNVGVWHLVVESDEPEMAIQAVDTWGAVIVDEVSAAVDHSKRVVALDIQMTTLAEARLAAEIRQEVLVYAQRELTGWREYLESVQENTVIPAIDHWEILGIVSQTVEWGQPWDRLLDDAPVMGSISGAYKPWLENTLAIIDNELVLLPAKLVVIEETFSDAEMEYKSETAESLGLASTLVVEGIENQAPEVEIVRPSGTFSLVGGVIGFLLWIFLAFRQIERKEIE
jgi:hypothetical protein